MKALLASLSFLGAIGCLVLWIGMIGPTIARAFGVPMVRGYWRMDRKNQHLTRLQFAFWFGVVCFGLGLFLFNAAMDYLPWLATGDEDWYPRSERVVRSLFIWVVAGALVGLIPPSGRKSDAS